MRYDRAGRPALRRDQRVHQVDPRLRPRRRAALPRPDARGGGGPAVRRAAADGARERGRRAGRPDGAAGGGGGGPGRRSSSGCRRPGSRWRRPRCTWRRRRSRTRSSPRSTPRWRTCGPARPAPVPAAPARRALRGRAEAGQRGRLPLPARRRGAVVGAAVPARRAGRPRLLPADRRTARSGCWPSGCRSCAGSSGANGRSAAEVGYSGSRSIGQLMHRGPPRPRPSSPPGISSTSMPFARR